MDALPFITLSEPSLDFSRVHLFPVVARWNPDRPPAGVPRAAVRLHLLRRFENARQYGRDLDGTPVYLDPDDVIACINMLEAELWPRRI